MYDKLTWTRPSVSGTVDYCGRIDGSGKSTQLWTPAEVAVGIRNIECSSQNGTLPHSWMKRLNAEEKKSADPDDLQSSSCHRFCRSSCASHPTAVKIRHDRVCRSLCLYGIRTWCHTRCPSRRVRSSMDLRSNQTSVFILKCHWSIVKTNSEWTHWTEISWGRNGSRLKQWSEREF